MPSCPLGGRCPVDGELRPASGRMHTPYTVLIFPGVRRWRLADCYSISFPPSKQFHTVEWNTEQFGLQITALRRNFSQEFKNSEWARVASDVIQAIVDLYHPQISAQQPAKANVYQQGSNPTARYYTNQF